MTSYTNSAQDDSKSEVCWNWTIDSMFSHLFNTNLTFQTQVQNLSRIFFNYSSNIPWVLSILTIISDLSHLHMEQTVLYVARGRTVSSRVLEIHGGKHDPDHAVNGHNTLSIYYQPAFPLPRKFRQIILLSSGTGIEFDVPHWRLNPGACA